MTRIVALPAWMLLVAGLMGTGIRQANAEIAWQSQLKTAHAQAEAEGKLLLLHFYDDNCVWCDRLENGAFQAPEVAQAIDKNYVPVKIHASKSPMIASTFKVTRYPTDVIVTTQGQALAHTVSPQDPSRYVAMLAQHAMPASRTLATNVAPAANESASKPTSSNSIPVQGAGYVMPAQNAGTPASPISHSGVASAAAADMNSKANAHRDLELAMDGYCAVTVIEKDRWIEGKAEFGVVHLGRLYLFSDKTAMDRFLTNPEPYTPVLNGIDVVRFFEERKIVPGNREWGLKDPDHNRMFFFADEAALNHFYNQHTRYTEAALTVMKKAIADANPAK